MMEKKDSEEDEELGEEEEEDELEEEDLYEEEEEEEDEELEGEEGIQSWAMILVQVLPTSWMSRSKEATKQRKRVKKCVGDFVVRVLTRVFISMKSLGLLFKKVEVSSSIDCLLHQDAFHLFWLTKIKGFVKGFVVLLLSYFTLVELMVCV